MITMTYAQYSLDNEKLEKPNKYVPTTEITIAEQWKTADSEKFWYFKSIHYCIEGVYTTQFTQKTDLQAVTTRKTKKGILASLDCLFGNITICCVKF